MKAAPTLRGADVLLWAGCDTGAAQDAPTEYARMLAALPNANVSLVWAERLAYKQGALASFLYLLHYGWFENYDWVVRLNPDVLVLDEEPLVLRMLNESHASVLSNCGYLGKKTTTEKIHTDFFAVRPQHFRPMANWTTFSSSAEREAGAYFKPLIEQGLTAWLPNGNTGWLCRMIHHERGSGIEHTHQADNCGLASHTHGKLEHQSNRSAAGARLRRAAQQPGRRGTTRFLGTGGRRCRWTGQPRPANRDVGAFNRTS